MFSVFVLQHSLEIADTPPKPMAPIISQAEFDDMPIPAAASRSAASSRNFGSGLQHPPEPDEELPPEPAPRKSLAASREKNAGPQNKNNGTQCPEMMLNKIEKTFNKTCTGLKSFLQRF